MKYLQSKHCQVVLLWQVILLKARVYQKFLLISLLKICLSLHGNGKKNPVLSRYYSAEIIKGNHTHCWEICWFKLIGHLLHYQDTREVSNHLGSCVEKKVVVLLN